MLRSLFCLMHQFLFKYLLPLFNNKLSFTMGYVKCSNRQTGQPHASVVCVDRRRYLAHLHNQYCSSTIWLYYVYKYIYIDARDNLV